MRVTLSDVARHANVSAQTVSNVINGRSEHVGARTRAQVLNAIADLRYRPNLAARHLRNIPVGVLAIAFPDLTNPYFSDIATAVIKEAGARGYTVLVDHTFADRAQETLVANGFRPHLIDGVILDPQALRREDLEPREGSIPAVLLGEHFSDWPRDNVAIDNIGAAREITRHLLRLGRRRIAVIGIREESSFAAPGMRFQGYAEALAEAGMTPDPLMAIAANPWGRPEGAQGMRQLLSLPEPPDAVFGFNDLMALGAMHVAREAGFDVPHDIALAGIDDIEDGQFANPALTTIAPDKEGIARAAVEMLLARIDGTRTGPPELVTPSFRLIVRESTVGASSAAQPSPTVHL